MRYWTGPGAGQGLYTGSQNDQGGLVLQLLSFLTLTMETKSRCKILRSNKPLVSLFTRRCGPFALREKPPCEDGLLCPVSGIGAWIQQRLSVLSLPIDRGTVVQEPKASSGKMEMEEATTSFPDCLQSF